MKWALLGASSGLGLAFHELLIEKNVQDQFLNISRKASPAPRSAPLQADFSKEDQWTRVVEVIKDFQPDWILYFAGGGPYGRFDKKNFRDHQWAFRVNFEFPAFLLHQVMQSKLAKISSASMNVCLIGSSIAESSPDPMAASYAAAKHALKGLVDSVQLEIQKDGLDFKLHHFSPGYMDTPMLPGNAWPRQQGLVQAPKLIAEKLLNELFPS